MILRHDPFFLLVVELFPCAVCRGDEFGVFHGGEADSPLRIRLRRARLAGQTGRRSSGDGVAMSVSRCSDVFI